MLLHSTPNCRLGSTKIALIVLFGTAIYFTAIWTVRNYTENTTKVIGCRDGVILEGLHASENRWYEAVLQRREFFALKGGVDKVKPMGDAGFTVIWDLIAPSFDCPQGKKRVGSIGDGGKWVCGFEVFEQTKKTGAPCVVYSFGVQDDSSFEALFLQRTNCHVFSYDMSVSQIGNPLRGHSNPKLKFASIGLGDKNNDTRKLKTLGTLMEENGHTWLDVLKLDIEWMEIPVFEEFLKIYDVMPFGQLQVEVHLPEPFSFPKFYNMWERLEEKGLRPFSAETNLWPCLTLPLGYGTVQSRSDPRFVEYSFINVRSNHLLVPSGFVPKI
ncbi:Methyltransferase-like protein 24 [Orchesella cincta]|uniref:Methyltransferase-like protein 24 n=1 Tax=Orchesella cincta TaxID=48709 RepID=A0A1D2MG98_ORCCI|nr:Methyltransferase-like protein 24 [Orchesella cincta]